MTEHDNRLKQFLELAKKANNLLPRENSVVTASLGPEKVEELQPELVSALNLDWKSQKFDTLELPIFLKYETSWDRVRYNMALVAALSAPIVIMEELDQVNPLIRPAAVVAAASSAALSRFVPTRATMWLALPYQFSTKENVQSGSIALHGLQVVDRVSLKPRAVFANDISQFEMSSIPTFVESELRKNNFSQPATSLRIKTFTKILERAIT